MTSRPDCFVVDLVLPDGSGTELLDDAVARGCGFVVLTGHPSVETSVESLRKGASDYLVKPLTTTKLGRLMQSCRIPAPGNGRGRVDGTASNDDGRAGIEVLADVERVHIERAVAACGSRAEAAQKLGISIRTLYNKLKTYERARAVRDADGEDHARSLDAR
jgi:DNA-binding NtrC family response regulator